MIQWNYSLNEGFGKEIIGNIHIENSLIQNKQIRYHLNKPGGKKTSQDIRMFAYA